jgi:hypothetical protein
MRRLLALAICLSLASTLALSLGCEKKKEAPPQAKEEVAPAPPEKATEVPGTVEKPHVEEEEHVD